jgi:hypothetical protein
VEAVATGGPVVEKVSGVKEASIHGDEAAGTVRRGARSVVGERSMVGPSCRKAIQKEFLFWIRIGLVV